MSDYQCQASSSMANHPDRFIIKSMKTYLGEHISVLYESNIQKFWFSHNFVLNTSQ